MKKFFALTVLLSAFLLPAIFLTSCGFNANQKGTVDFSIPLADIVALKNEVYTETDSVSESENKDDKNDFEQSEEAYVHALVQIKGDGGVYRAKYKRVDNPEMNNLLETKLNFHFSELPVDQNYKVMVDIFDQRIYSYKVDGEIQQESDVKLSYSGENKNIRVNANEVTPVEITVKGAHEQTSMFDVKLDNELFEVDNPYEINNLRIAYCESEKKYYYQKVSEEKTQDSYGDIEVLQNENPDDWAEFKDLSFAFKESCHFADFDALMIQYDYSYDDETGAYKDERKVIPLKFKNGVCLMNEYLEKNSSHFGAVKLTQIIGNSAFGFTTEFPSFHIISITFDEELKSDPSNPNGTIIVSIPDSISSNSGYSQDDTSQQNLLRYVVQLKGNGGDKYYAAQTKTINIKDAADNPRFTFKDLPVNQTYKVMIDVYSETLRDGQISGHALLAYSGDKDEIIVEAGKTSSAKISVKQRSAYSYSNFNLILSYKENNEAKTKRLLLDSPENLPLVFARSTEVSDDKKEYKYYFKEKAESDGESLVWGFKDQKLSDWTEFTGISFELREDSHFWGFDFVQPVEDLTSGTGTKNVTLKFNDKGICDVTEYLGENNYLFNYPLTATKKVEDSEISSSMCVPSVSFTSISFEEEKVEEADDPTEEPVVEPEPEPEPTPVEETAIQETKAGVIEINENTAVFEIWNDSKQKDTKRYMHTESLTSILDGKKLSDGDTVVFVLNILQGQNDSGRTVLPDSDIFKACNVSQFYYQLQTSNWQRKDDEELFKNNNCINFTTRDSGEYTFVMPLNFVQDAKDYNQLQLFFDSDKDEGKIELKCSIKYYIFPASQKVFVFGVGKNWDPAVQNEYRYEFNIPLLDAEGKEYSLKEGDAVTINFNGGTLQTLGWPKAGQTEVSNTKLNIQLTGELYDAAEYTDSIHGNYFHPLSNDKATNSIKQISFDGQSSSVLYGKKFLFEDIIAPHSETGNSFKNDFKIQCVAPCQNPETLLLIIGYDLTSKVN